MTNPPTRQHHRRIPHIDTCEKHHGAHVGKNFDNCVDNEGSDVGVRVCDGEGGCVDEGLDVGGCKGVCGCECGCDRFHGGGLGGKGGG